MTNDQGTLLRTQATSYPKRMTRQQAAEYLREAHGVRCTWHRLAKFAVYGGGPRFFKDGRWPVYDRDELDRWAEQRLGRAARSTAEHSLSA